MTEAGTIATPEEKIPFPKATIFVLVHKLCERFSYYGMRAVLVLYLTRNIGFTENQGTVMFHCFLTFLYIPCIFGGILADSWLGRYKVGCYGLILYSFGMSTLALGAATPNVLDPFTFTLLALLMICFGSGTLEACIPPICGDQFKLPEQAEQLAKFYGMFYVMANAGAIMAMFLTPKLRQDVHCFGQKECYALAFGVPAILLIVAAILFISGGPFYRKMPPSGNVVVYACRAIASSISNWRNERRTNPRSTLLDYADSQFDPQLIRDVKAVLRFIVILLPLPFFWALFDQQASRWTLQATHMDGDMGTWDIKPDQFQLINPFLVMILIPIFDFFVYPLLQYVFISTQLRKISTGGVLVGTAFAVSGILELFLEATYPILPMDGVAHLRIVNGESCDYTLTTNIPGFKSFELKAMDVYVNQDICIPEGTLDFQYTFAPKNDDCPKFESGQNSMEGGKAYVLFMGSKNAETPLLWYEDFVQKPKRSQTMVRVLSNVKPGVNVKWLEVATGVFEYDEPAYANDLIMLNKRLHKLFVGDVEVHTSHLKTGAVYAFILTEAPAGFYKVKEVEIVAPNSIKMLWQIPQYVLLTAGEIMFNITFTYFTYTQAPISMKAVMQACWLLTLSAGNGVVVIIAGLLHLDHQSSEFFLFASLMYFVMCIFVYLAYKYKPNVPLQAST